MKRVKSVFNKTIIFLFFIFIVFNNTGIVFGDDEIKNPKWTNSGTHPKYPKSIYILGVGVTQLSDKIDEDRSRADSNARADIAKQIKVSLSQEMKIYEAEIQKNDESISEMEVSLTGLESVNITLQGVEIVQHHTNKKENVLYSLAVINRQKAAEKLKLIVSDTKKISADYIKKGESIFLSDPIASLRLYIKALNEIKSHLADGILLRTLSGESVNILSTAEIDLKIAKIFSGLTINKVSGDNQRAEVGKALKLPLKMQLVTTDNGNQIPFKNFPFNFKMDGKGRIEEQVKSDSAGFVSSKIYDIGSTGKAENRVVATADWKAFFDDTGLKKEIVKPHSKDLKVVFTYKLKTVGTTRIIVYLIDKIIESNKQENPYIFSESVIENTIINSLSKKGFDVKDNKTAFKSENGKDLINSSPKNIAESCKDSADVVIIGSTISEFSSKMSERLIFHRARLTLRAIDIHTGQVLANLDLESKGAGNNELKAGKKAIKKLKKKVSSKLVPKLISGIKN